MTVPAPDLAITVLPPPPGAEPDVDRVARVHDAVMAGLAVAGPYRFARVDGPVGSRDAVAQVCDAAYRTLRQHPPGAEVTLVVAFEVAVGDPALFDALVWGQRQGMAEIDRLRYPRAPGGGSDGMSIAGRPARMAAVAAEGGSFDTLVLHFPPVTAASRAP